MSSKATLFLTNRNEHFYEETLEPHYDSNGKFIGYTLVLEMSKENARIISDDEDDIQIEIFNPESELYKNMMKMKDK